MIAKILEKLTGKDDLERVAYKSKVFSLGCISILLADVTKHVEVDFVDLNPFSKKSWEIGIGKNHDT